MRIAGQHPKKTEAKRRRDRRLYMRDYRARKASEHPTLTREAILAVEEAAGFECGARLEPAVALTSQAPIMATEKKPVTDCTAALEEFERLTAKAIEGLQVLKHEPEQKIRIPPPLDLPNGIIL